MIELITDPTPGRIEYFQDILESEGIQTFIRNQNMSGTEGMIPIFHPGLCIVNDRDEARARELIQKNLVLEDTDLPDVRCPHCGETNPGNFGQCWNCSGRLAN